MKKVQNDRFNFDLIFLIVTILLAGWLRIYKLQQLPAGLHNDEASFLVNSRSFLINGHDEDGRAWPMYLNSYIDPKPALFSYIQMPFLVLFEQPLLAARLPSALFGIAAVVAGSYYVWLLSNDKKLALAILFLQAISPWHIMVSRATQEVIVSHFFLLLSLLLLLLFHRSVWEKHKLKKACFLLGSLFSGYLAIYFYHSAKVVWPILFLGQQLVMITFNQKKGVKQLQLSKIFKQIALSTLAVILILMSQLVLFPQSLDRFRNLSLFQQSEVQLVLDEQIRTLGHDVPIVVARFFHNKLLNYLRYFFKLYSRFFTVNFLFISGGEPYRYQIPFHGLLYLPELWLILVGVASLIVSWSRNMLPAGHQKTTIMMVLMLLSAPLPTLVTTHEQLSVIRTFLMVVPLLYLVAQGWLWLQAGKKLIYKIPVVLGVISYIYFGAYFWHQFNYFQPRYQPWHRNVPDSKLAQSLKRIGKQYERIVISRWSGQPYAYFVLEGLISTEQLQQSYPRRLQSNYSLDKYYFVEKDCPIDTQENVLFVVRDNCRFKKINQSLSNGQYQVIDRISFADGAPAYQFVVYQAIK